MSRRKLVFSEKVNVGAGEVRVPSDLISSMWPIVPNQRDCAGQTRSCPLSEPYREILSKGPVLPEENLESLSAIWRRAQMEVGASMLILF